MNGYWHFVALAAGVSALTIIYAHNWFIIGFFIWLLYLHLFRGLGIIPTVFSLLGLLFFMFYIPSVNTPPTPTTPASQDESPIVGIIRSPVKETSTHIQFTVQDENTDKKLLVYYFKDNSSYMLPDVDIEYGARCELKGKSDTVEQATNPGEFDYQDYLHKQGLNGQIVVDSLHDIHCADSHPLAYIYSLRTSLMSFVHSHMSNYSAAWVNALIFGDDSFLSDDTIVLFQHWGLSHLLAISGLHVGLVVSLLYFVLIKLNIVTKERAQLIMMLFLPLYALLAGGEPSVWRACAMVLLVILFHTFHIRMSITDVFSLVFIGLLFVDPSLIYHVGFQFSFIVTFGLLLSKRWLLQSKHPIFLVIQISFVSQMMIVPLQINYFSVFQPLSILLNVLVVPYFTILVIPFMFILLFISPISFLANGLDIIFKLIHKSFIWIVKVVDSVADFPFILGSFPLLFAAFYYIFFFTMMQHMELKKRTNAFLYGCLLVLVLVGLTLKPYLSPEGRVTMLDVGQGDSFVIELPYRKAVILYDAAAKVSFNDQQPTDSVYKNVIKPYLYNRGIQEIDTIFLSHEHIDHMGSVGYLLNDFNVKRIVTHSYYENPEDTQAEWDKNPTQLLKVPMGEKFTIAGQEFFVLSPGDDKGSPNENSLVLYTVFADKKWLFTGDIEDKAERDMMKNYSTLDVDIHQVGHHGSDTSTSQAFMDYLNPEYSLISVGRNNRYGHPNNQVLNVINNANTTLLRTDKHGAITFRFKGDKGFFNQFIPD